MLQRLAAPRPTHRARPHPTATTPLIRPTPAPAAAATPRQTPARQAGDREARQPAHGRPLPLPRLRPADRHRRAAHRSQHQYEYSATLRAPSTLTPEVAPPWSG